MISVISNILDDNYKQKLNEELLGLNFPWYWNDQTVQKNKGIKTSIFQLCHVFYRNNTINSDHFNLVYPIVGLFEKHSGIEVKKLHRIKANLLNRQTFDEESVKNSIHTDVDFDGCISLIYYLHDVDGNLNIYDDKYNVLDSYTPKENSLVYFKSNILHGTRPPIIEKRRVCINFILQIKD